MDFGSDISWFKRQSLTFMILKYRFNSFRDGPILGPMGSFIGKIIILCSEKSPKSSNLKYLANILFLGGLGAK